MKLTGLLPGPAAGLTTMVLQTLDKPKLRHGHATTATQVGTKDKAMTDMTVLTGTVTMASMIAMTGKAVRDTLKTTDSLNVTGIANALQAIPPVAVHHLPVGTGTGRVLSMPHDMTANLGTAVNSAMTDMTTIAATVAATDRQAMGGQTGTDSWTDSLTGIGVTEAEVLVRTGLESQAEIGMGEEHLFAS